MKRKITIEYDHFEGLEHLPASDRALVEAAIAACRKAYAPYSHFSVGAAARLSSGRIVWAANVESEAFPSGMCAERSLLYNCASNYADEQIEALAIASDPSLRECYPCGACRQVMLDAECRQQRPIRVIMWGAGGASVVDSVESLLPFTFKL